MNEFQGSFLGKDYIKYFFFSCTVLLFHDLWWSDVCGQSAQVPSNSSKLFQPQRCSREAKGKNGSWRHNSHPQFTALCQSDVFLLIQTLQMVLNLSPTILHTFQTSRFICLMTLKGIWCLSLSILFCLDYLL